MPSMFDRNCDHCGVRYRGTGRNFCSGTCRSIASRNRIEFNCKSCGIRCSRPASHAKYSAAEFCSLKCWYGFAKGKELTGKITIRSFTCLHCGKVFDARPSVHERRYCTMACQNAGRPPCPKRRKPRIDVVCAQCGGSFKRLRCQIVGIRGRFCSQTCRANYSNTVQSKTISSGIERRFFDECEMHGAKLVRQVHIGKYWLDAASTDGRFGFEFDGEYWHSTDRIKRKDQQKDAFMKARGITVIRIPEMLYRSSPLQAISMVINA